MGAVYYAKWRRLQVCGLVAFGAPLHFGLIVWQFTDGIGEGECPDSAHVTIAIGLGYIIHFGHYESWSDSVWQGLMLKLNGALMACVHDLSFEKLALKRMAFENAIGVSRRQTCVVAQTGCDVGGC